MERNKKTIEMKFLIIEQDLRVSGTSQGVISRSFLAKLRMAYPNSIIDVVYLKHQSSDDQLHLLPVDHIETHVLNLKIPFLVKFINRIYWRLFHVSLNERYIHKVYASYIAKVKYESYDHIFIRSAGIEHEIILATHNLPILKKAIVNFHDPYPLPWYVGTTKALSNLEFFKLKKVIAIVEQAKTCSSSAYCMSHDLQHLYASKKPFYTLPHQYDARVFDLSDKEYVLKKTKKVTISYHGAIMFGRNADIVLDAYQELIHENVIYKEQTEFIMRLKGGDNIRLRNKYKSTTNIQIFDTLNFYNSSNEQIYETDIAIILENGPLYCNILVGKAPFLAAYKKPILSISPKRSELRNCIIDQKYIATMDNKEEIKFKLEQLIIDRMSSNKEVFPFGDYFSDMNFKKSLDEILQA
jgi:hypothetical protein